MGAALPLERFLCGGGGAGAAAAPARERGVCTTAQYRMSPQGQLILWVWNEILGSLYVPRVWNLMKF